MTITCFCGCGKTRPAFDKFNRPRMFIAGHNHLVKGKHPNYKRESK